MTERGKAAVTRSTRAVMVWPHGQLSTQDQENLTTVPATRRPSRARTALGGQIGVLLDDRPDLLADVLAVLKRETGDHIAQTMTLEDNNRSVVQNSGCNVSG